MFIRRTKTASEAAAVQILNKENRELVAIDHIGPSTRVRYSYNSYNDYKL